MPRSRSRKKRDGRRGGSRPAVPDSSVLLELLDLLNPASAYHAASDDGEEADEADDRLFVLEAFDRAAWSFHAGPYLEYVGDGAMERSLARLRAREWFLFECEMPSGLTPAEEWLDAHAGEPGSGSERRAIRRFLQGECGVFDVREVRPDGWMVLSPLDGGEVVRARRIERAIQMVSGDNPALPIFQVGNTIAGRLYRQDQERAELSAGACVLSDEMRAHLLSDPPAEGELRSGINLEAALGADASSLLDGAPSPCFPQLVDSLLWPVSAGTFDYRRLWRELDGEPNPVAVSRQLLSEFDPSTDVEPQLMAWAVAGTWLRRVEASAGRQLTSETLQGERRALEEHVRTVLNVPGEIELRAAAPLLSIQDDEALARIEELEVDDVEWIVDIVPDPLRLCQPPAFTPAPALPACLIVEQPTILPDAEGAEEDEEDDEDVEDDEDEEDEPDEDDGWGDEDEEEDPGAGGKLQLPRQPHEGAPLVLQHVSVNEADDPAAVALAALVETLLAEGRETRPERIVFRQRAIAARVADTLQDAGLDVELRYFDEAVDLATVDLDVERLVGPSQQGGPSHQVGPSLRDGRAEAGPPGEGAGSVVAATETERRAYERLVDAARRAEESLHELAANTAVRGDTALLLALAQPLAFPFAAWEGLDHHVGTMAVIAESEAGELFLRIHLAAPGQESRFDCRSPAGELIMGSSDSIQLDLVPADGGAVPPPLRAARFIGRDEGERLIVVPLRYREDAPAELLRGRDLDVAAGVMEAVAAAGARMLDEGAEAGSIEVNVDPLGDVKVSWRGWS